MNKYFFIKNYYKIVFGLIAIATLISSILFIVLYYCCKINDARCMVTVIPVLLVLIYVCISKYLLYKRVINFVREESKLKHYLSSKITRAQLIEGLKEKEFDIYCVDNMEVGLQQINEKTKLCQYKYGYVFMILDETVDEEKIFVETKELNKIIDNYFNKQKKANGYPILRPIYCFWGEKLSDERIEKCKNGLALKNGHAVQNFYIGYETYSQNLYFAEAIQEITVLGEFKTPIQWIKDIFKIGDNIDSL
ncbi:hypothetical protein [Inconstantimicrobium mannanitabidum]|uniref:Uncharacterized protein n=1 Tax=Inconstantimicrobium mannanitabidum TaxID=1604901 RepID=A0ACB5RAP1_9CLOT|nr:hypothetical protein [Clostridium sp. TW13]GKX65934.1 hypothetical protein rsdtw13_11920 [Clostridium sp. TW13]